MRRVSRPNPARPVNRFARPWMPRPLARRPRHVKRHKHKRGIPTRPVVERDPWRQAQGLATSVKTETIDELEWRGDIRRGRSPRRKRRKSKPKQWSLGGSGFRPRDVPGLGAGRRVTEQAAAAGGDAPRRGRRTPSSGAPATARAMPEVNPEPMMQADLANAVHVDPRLAAEVESKPKKKSPSLFERVTGVGRKEEPETAAPIQQTLSGVGSEDGVSKTTFSAQDDDMLDIPAFLRRQATRRSRESD